MEALPRYRYAFDLLSLRSRRRLTTIAIARALAVSLDLAAFAALYLGLNFMTQNSSSRDYYYLPSTFVEASVEGKFALIGIVSIVLFSAKGGLSLLLLASQSATLAREEARISSDWALRVLSANLERKSSLELGVLNHSLSSGVAAVVSQTVGMGLSILSEGVAILIVGVVLVLVNPVVALAATVYLAALSLVVHLLIGKHVQRLGRERTLAANLTYLIFRDSLQNSKVLRLSGRLEYFMDRYREVRISDSKALAKLTVTTNVPKYVFELGLIVGGFLLAFGQIATTDIITSAGMVATFLVAGGRIAPNFLAILTASSMFKNSSADFEMARTLNDEFKNG